MLKKVRVIHSFKY